MRDQIELHDSNAVFSYRDDAVVIDLCPAYVHHWELVSGRWVGAGRLQGARLIVSGVLGEPSLPNGQVELSGGVANCGGQAFPNLIPIPLRHPGAVQLRLEIEMGSPVAFEGMGFTAELLGDWRELEPLPAAWAPSEPVE